jgi:hypothetical protein
LYEWSTRRRSAALSKRDTWSDGQVSKDHATFGHSNDAIDAAENGFPALE